MYYHQATVQDDAEHFARAIIKYFNDHIVRKHWSLINRDDVPDGTKVIPSVWSAPVVSWWVLRLFFILSVIYKWKTRQVDFVLAYPQDPIEHDMYMSLPAGVDAKYGKDKVLMLHKNLYEQKQVGIQFFLYAKENMEKLGWEQSSINECVYYKDGTILLQYVDDLIIMNRNDETIDKEIQRLQDIFNMEDMGNVHDYLGVTIQRENDKIILKQTQIIDQLIDDANISNELPLSKCPQNP